MKKEDTKMYLNFKRIIAVILFVISLSALSGCLSEDVIKSCENTPSAKQRMTDPNGVWECQYILYSQTECAIGNFTDEYLKKYDYSAYVFLPSHIGDATVVQFGYLSGMVYHYFLSLGTFYVPHAYREINSVSAEQVYMLSGNKIVKYFNAQCYVPEKYYLYYKELWQKDSYLNKANVVYDINYLNEEYQYHCVDNYDYGSKIKIIPPDPIREGYTFDGWYKEAECVNKWNFENDTLPEIKIDEDEKVIFQETALYAKWILN